MHFSPLGTKLYFHVNSSRKYYLKMGKYTIFYLFENPRRGMQARKFTTNVPKILDLKFRTDIFRKLTLGAPDLYGKQFKRDWKGGKVVFLFFRGHCDRYF